MDKRVAEERLWIAGLDEQHLARLLDETHAGVLVVDADRFVVLGAQGWVASALGLDGRAGERGLGELFLGLSDSQASALLRRLRRGLIDHLVIETRQRKDDGSGREIELRFTYSDEPAPRYTVLVVDASERSRSDDLALRRERLRDALAEILRLLTRIDNRDELYRAACRIAVDRGGFRMAWVGLVDDATGDVMPVAAAGDSEGYVENLHLNVRNDVRGPGMTVTALRTGQPVAIADPRVDSMFSTLRQQVLARGFQSAVSLPLIVEGKTIGALTVYGDVVNAFGAIEVELLQHLADDMSFKLEVIGREEARRAIQVERDRLAAVVEQAGESVVVTDKERRIVYVNRAFTRITGYAAEEVIGRRTDFLGGQTQPEADGTALAKAIREGRSWAGPTRGRTKDGGDNDLHLMVSPRVDEAGNVIGSIMIGRDISREKSLEAQLLQSQKMEAIGRLAGGIAHDFNNLLTAISGYAEILRAELGPTDNRGEDVAEIQRAAARATQLTSQLLAFSRRQVLSLQALNPNTVVIELEPLLRRLIGEDVELVVDVCPDLGPILADPSQLDQVLINLALNARDAMPTGGRLVISADEVDLDEPFTEAHLGSRAGRYVELQVTDTGAGMTPEVLRQAFDPFFTTKAPGKGTGLGLSTVLGIVEQSNGYVYADSRPGGGSTFHVYLPKVAGAAVERIVELAPPPGVPAPATILLVEDEGPVRSLACRVLRQAGFTVLDAGSGEEALALEQSWVGPLDLLFTDVVLPGLSGPQVATELKKRRPGMPVLYASGYNDEMVAARGVLERGDSYMSKPYKPTELVDRVRTLVGEVEPSAGAETDA